MASPLEGVRVVDLTRVLAGPFCTMMLGDLGAEVIKIEPPDGDPIRQQSTGALRGYFAAYNRNKKSVCLDLYRPADRDALKRLLATADVLVENFRPGVLARMDLGRAALERINPKLIVCSISGFGDCGPYADRPAFDFIAQAMSGFMSVTGDASHPMRAGPPVGDLVAGLYGALGITAALAERRQSGQGQYVQASLLNGLVSFLSFFGVSYLESGKLPERTGNGHFVVAPYGLFDAADGAIAIAPSNESILRKFLGALGLMGLLDDPRFATNADRLAHRDELNAEINAVLRLKSRAHWISALNGAGVPSGEVMTVAEILDGDHARAQNLVMQVPDGAGGPPVRVTGFPLTFSRTPCTVTLPPPILGAHTSEVLEPGQYRPKESPQKSQ
jgi:crotonobetainyl-CoA:carnitine CoA-transferase CaiB-like acyl-CoA transferase